MRVSFRTLKVDFSKVLSYTNKTVSVTNSFFKENELIKQLVTLSLMIALLTPAFLFGDWAKKVGAFQRSFLSSSSQSQTPVQNAAPPTPFIVTSSDTFSANPASTIMAVNMSIADGFISAANLFKAPQLPEGFEAAKPVSPAAAFLVSVGDSVGSLFGFFSTTNPSLIPALPPLVPVGSTSFDFDGDGKADAARFRSSTGAWEIKYSATNTTGSGILAAGRLAPADYDGDGKTDLASFNNGTWTILKSSTNQTIQVTGFGVSTDIPVSGNYIGTSAADLAVWRPSNGTWYIREIGNAAITSYQFGQSGDIAVPGNYDGDGVMDYAVFRPAGGVWHIQGSSAGYYYVGWGVASDIPVAADYDGDGKTDLAVYRGSSGAWYALKSSTNNGSYMVDTWGNYGDQPIPADYDADGKADFSIYRPTTGVWHTKKSNGGSYEFTALGTPQDTAVTSAYIKQVGGQVVSYDMAKTRLSPKNATGGTDLYSRNFGWSSPLVGLSGRAGLNTGFGISYNSLVWTKHTDPATSNSTMYFDVDNSNISPGFRFGFSTIEPVYYDSQTGAFSYLMVSPSGARTEFKQIGASDTYETVDSSYVQLRTKGADSANDPVENITITVAGTDGAKMIYNWKGGAFRASEIKDRNGNFITISHDEYGLLQSVTDTLGRIVTVEYDSQLYPTAIKQSWKDNNGQGTTNVTHYWARFEYATINVNPSFANTLGVYGPTGGTPVKVLSKIKGDDDSYTVFEYQSNGFGQVSKIRSFAPDNHELNYVQTNLASPGTNLTDCPKLSQTKTWAENFNGGSETVINNSLTSNQSYSLPDGHSGTAAKIEVTMANHPHGALSKTFVGESGWMEALPIATEDWANGTSSLERKRWTWTDWTQDDTNLSYILNPRSKESKVGDTGNIKRTTVEYLMQSSNSPISQFGLVSAVNVYDTNQTTVLKRAETVYNLSSTYVSKRIIGLPSEIRAYGFENSALPLASRVTFAYDEEDFAQETNQNISSVIQHDNSNFSSSFIIGRGNLTSTTRWNADFSTTLTAAVTSKVRYDIAGSVVAQLDPLNRKVRIEYADVFNDTTTSRNTFAYPTKVYDSANNFSEVKYRFDTGANVWAKSPAPALNTIGKETTRLYDAIGRLSKETLINTGAYTRYEYPTNSIQSKLYSTIIDTNGNGADSSDEVYSESWADGAGRTLRSRTEHPDSTGGWTGSLVEYDVLGQVKRSTVPTEISVSGNTWTPAGDDNRGLDVNSNPVWLWQSQEYDWKGRITRAINTDGTDKLYNYQGCGCAGGQVTTIQSELVPRDDNPSQTARRTQKIYEDILGRAYKTEVLKWDAMTLYSKTENFFNRRDQITTTRQSDYSSPFPYSDRDVTMTYDGHGRMATRHYPIENSGTNTSWTYNIDDSIQTAVDPRGVTTNFLYNSRGLLETIAYDVPSNQPNIPDTPDVTYNYDNLGNRTSMLDGTGTTSYAYNSLSQMTSETKAFTGRTETYTINYGYNFGNLTSISNPFNSNEQIKYGYDKIARMNSAAGQIQGTPTNSQVTATKYRAWGALKEYQFSNPANGAAANMKFKYDARLLVSSYEVSSNNSLSDSLQFERYADGKLKFAKEGNPDWQWEGRRWLDRSYIYDFTGRLTQAYSGKEANNLPNVVDGPYKQLYTYNSFNEITQTSGKYWGTNMKTVTTSFNAGGRAGDSGYDASGNSVSFKVKEIPLQPTIYGTAKFDASGRQVESYTPQLNINTPAKTRTNTYDGNGKPVKTQETSGSNNLQSFEINSTVLSGATVGSFGTSNGVEQKTFSAPVNGATFYGESVGNMTLHWTGGEGLRKYVNSYQATESDPRGEEVELDNPYNSLQGPSAESNYAGCSWEGLQMSCEMSSRLYSSAGYKNSLIPPPAKPEKPTERAGDTQHEAMHDSKPARATSNTQKPSDTPSTEDATSTNTIPSEDGCQEDSDGNPYCVVQSEPWRESPIDSFNVDEPLSQGDCDNFIASLFGGEGAVVTTSIEPVTIKATTELVNNKPIFINGKAQWTNKVEETENDRTSHLADNATFHIYPDRVGTDSLEVGLFVPKGAIVSKLVGERELKEGSSPSTNTFAFKFVSGPYKGVEIWFDHVGGTYGGKFGGDRLGKEFINNRDELIGPKNAAGSSQIGFIGGPGGRQPDNYTPKLYRHSHGVTKFKGKRTDPRKIFCRW